MSRSLVFAPLIALLCGLVGCRAQDDRRALQNSVLRLEQRLKAVNKHLQEIETDQAAVQDRRASELQEKDREIQQLRELVARHEAEAARREAATQQQQAELEARARQAQQELEGRSRQAQQELEQRTEELRRRMVAERAEQQERLRAESRELRERMQAEQQRLAATREELQQRLHAEREQMNAELREREQALTAQQRDLAAAHAKLEEMQARLQDGAARQQELEALRGHLQEFERRAAATQNRGEELAAKLRRTQAENERLEAALAEATERRDDGVAAVRALREERAAVEQLRERVLRDVQAAHGRPQEPKADFAAIRRQMAEKDEAIRSLKQQLDEARGKAKAIAAKLEHAAAAKHGEEHGDEEAEVEQKGQIIINAEDGTVNLTLNIQNAAPAPERPVAARALFGAAPKATDAGRWVAEEPAAKVEEAKKKAAAAKKKAAAQKEAAAKRKAEAEERKAAAERRAAERKRRQADRERRRERAPKESGKKINEEDMPFPFPL